MKTLKKTIAAVVLTLLTFTAVNAQAPGDDALIGKAHGAAHDCLQPYLSNPIYEVGSSIETTGICFVEGFLKRVTFYAGPACHGPGPCPAFATRIVATVDFGCEGEVIGVTCY
jgi:hypothetical protein